MQNKSNHNIMFFETIDSTNTYGLKNFDNLSDKTVLLANEQTHGRGRFDRIWVSQNYDNIYMSFILKPQEKKYITNLTQYLSVVTSKVVETYGIQAEIKYPNDVLFEGKKICGILCEASLKKNVIQGVVLGIGINLNMPKEIIESIDRPANSLNLILNKKIDRDEFLCKLLDEFFANYENAVNNGFESFKKEYVNRIKFLGKNILVQQRDGAPKEEYQALRIDNNGNLIVKTKDNKEKIILSGDIFVS